MGIKWRDFQFPRKITVVEDSYTPSYGKFIAEPFERGYGVTLGNSLRRVLSSSVEGTAVTGVRIKGASHEFSTLEHVKEDVTEIILNIKNLILKSYSKTPKKIHLKVSGEKEVLAKDIEADDTMEVVNPDLHIATLTDKDAELEIEMDVGRGRGFVPSEFNKKEEAPTGTIAVDSIFTPVRKVSFKVENARVGNRTNYDRLILEIWTNASIEPREALIYAAKVFSKHLELFFSLGEIAEEEEIEELTPEEVNLYEKLKLPISELELSVRSANCLREANIKTLLDLVEKTEAEMLSYRNFGKKSLVEISNLLKSMNLSLGMKVDKERMQLL
jgi:DNA-directed RNA polymerase subunit alpha